MDKEILQKELEFSAVRSGGPGGQHANKVSSKVIVLIDIENSQYDAVDEMLLVRGGTVRGGGLVVLGWR